MTKLTRNKIFEDKERLIGITMKKHRWLIRSARMEESDVRQELAVRLLEAISQYDPARCSNMDAYLTLTLRWALLHMRECAKLFGVPGAPRKGFTVVSMNAPDSTGREMQLPSDDRTHEIIWLENEIAGLPEVRVKGDKTDCQDKPTSLSPSRIPPS